MDFQVNHTLAMNDCTPDVSKTGQNFSHSGKCRKRGGIETVWGGNRGETELSQRSREGGMGKLIKSEYIGCDAPCSWHVQTERSPHAESSF